MSENKYFYFIILSVALTSMVQIFFKILVDYERENLLSLIYSYKFWLVIFLYAIAFVLWIIGISGIKFSIALPINIISVIFSGIAGYYIFGEKITTLMVVSYVLILSGLAMLMFGEN
jgi:drug/metabolite transporter (DMT)-like permease